MTVLAEHVTVTTAATPISSVPSVDSVHDSSPGEYLLVNNTGTVSIFLGDANVTTANGFEWKSTYPPLSITLEPGETLYGIVASGTQVVHALKAGR